MDPAQIRGISSVSKDYEEYAETTECWIYAAMVRPMLARLAA
jgi:hypothetical protein